MLTLPVYMDHHVTTPTDRRVVDAILPFFTQTFGNPASRHDSFGWAARDAVATAHRNVALLVGKVHFDVSEVDYVVEKDSKLVVRLREMSPV